MRTKNKINYKITEKLFGFTRQTYTKWKQEDRPIINLIEKYFSEDELREFIEYGTMEKYDFILFHNYLYAKYEFISILLALIDVANSLNKDEEMYIDYLAYSLSRDIYPDLFETKERFSKFIMQSYDNYKETHPTFNSMDLSESIERINLFFPKQEKYVDTIVYFMYKDFLPFIKACVLNQPEHINLAIEFCIKFNLYKYQSLLSYEEIYQQFKIPLKKAIDSEEASTIVDEKFDYEEFCVKINEIKQTYWSNKNKLTLDEIEFLEELKAKKKKL